jgi:hypothetical protein
LERFNYASRITFSALLSTFHFLLSTFYFPLSTFHFSLFTFYFSQITYHASLFTFHFFSMKNIKNADELKGRVLDPGVALWILLILLLLRGLLYTFSIPPWQHPDEPTHFEHVRLIAERWELPTPESISIDLRREIAQSMLANGFWDPESAPSLDDDSLSDPGVSPLGIYTLTHPRLYYVLAAAWLWPWLHLPVEGQLYLVRMLSVILNLVVVLATYRAVRILYPYRKWLAVMVSAFVVFQPVHTDIMSAVNNDVLINALAGLFFVVMAWIFQEGLDLKKGVFLIVLLILGFLTKTTAVVLMVSLPIGLLFYIWRSGHTKWFLGIAGFCLCILVVSVFLWQMDILQGWINQIGDVAGRYFRVTFSGTFQALQDPEFRELPLQAAPVVFRSFWGSFGWRHIWLPSVWYVLLGAVSLVSVVGLVVLTCLKIFHQERMKDLPYRASFLVYGFCTVLAACVAALLRSVAVQGLSPYLSHGRYVFIAMVPFALLFTLGLRAWTKPAWRRVAGGLFLLFLIAYDALCFWGIMMPYYY